MKQTKPTKPITRKAATKKTTRTRESVPVLVDISLGKLKDLFGDNDDAIVRVSRNFVLAVKEQQISDQAQFELGI